MAHDVSRLVEQAKGQMKESAAICEIDGWDAALNQYAKDGWLVKKCGTIETSNDVVFWALLKKREKQMDI